MGDKQLGLKAALYAIVEAAMDTHNRSIQLENKDEDGNDDSFYVSVLKSDEYAVLEKYREESE